MVVLVDAWCSFWAGSELDCVFKEYKNIHFKKIHGKTRLGGGSYLKQRLCCQQKGVKCQVLTPPAHLVEHPDLRAYQLLQLGWPSASIIACLPSFESAWNTAGGVVIDSIVAAFVRSLANSSAGDKAELGFFRLVRVQPAASTVASSAVTSRLRTNMILSTKFGEYWEISVNSGAEISTQLELKWLPPHLRPSRTGLGQWGSTTGAARDRR